MSSPSSPRRGSRGTNDHGGSSSSTTSSAALPARPTTTPSAHSRPSGWEYRHDRRSGPSHGTDDGRGGGNPPRRAAPRGVGRRPRARRRAVAARPARRPLHGAARGRADRGDLPVGGPVGPRRRGPGRGRLQRREPGRGNEGMGGRRPPLRDRRRRAGHRRVAPPRRTLADAPQRIQELPAGNHCRYPPIVHFDRATALEHLAAEEFDVVVVGGGITGAGCALDAATRRLRTALVERGDFADGTSSRSSKLVHGGIRYLEHREFGLVREGLAERQIALRNAPHLVHVLPFLIPVLTRDGLIDRRIARVLGGALWMYDLSGGLRIKKAHRRLSRDDALARVPTLRADALASAYLYFDAQADDARLTLAI